MTKRLTTWLTRCIDVYQGTLALWFGGQCRYYPSCSEYMRLSILKRGPFQGMIKGTSRILRCHPLHKGGIDLP